MFGRKQTPNPQIERLTQEVRASRSHLQAMVRQEVTHQANGIGMLFRVYASVHPVTIDVHD